MLSNGFCMPLPYQCLQLSSADTSKVAGVVFEHVFRTDLNQPGFSIVVLPVVTDSHGLRRSMIKLKEQLSLRHQSLYGEPLEYLSLVGSISKQQPGCIWMEHRSALF